MRRSVTFCQAPRRGAVTAMLSRPLEYMAALPTEKCVTLKTLLSGLVLVVSCSDRGAVTRPVSSSPIQHGFEGPATVAAEPEPVSAQWIDADKAVVRLPPSAFPGLPAAVRLALESRGCTIPQTYANPAPHNVIAGHIIARSRTDWAVLCSIHRASRILIFPGGEDESIIEWESSEDLRWLQAVGIGAIGYSRYISVVTPRAIRAYAKSELPTPLDHDGLDEAFIEKASTIHYWSHGQWLRLAGAD
jgi:hypothetical protein